MKRLATEVRIRHSRLYALAVSLNEVKRGVLLVELFTSLVALILVIGLVAVLRRAIARRSDRSSGSSNISEKRTSCVSPVEDLSDTHHIGLPGDHEDDDKYWRRYYR